MLRVASTVYTTTVMQLHVVALFLVVLMVQAATASWVWIPNHLERFVPSEVEAGAAPAHDGNMARMTRSDVAAFGEGIPPRAVRYQRTGGAILLGRR
ncbi:hypothetical protein PRIPAC_78372 [Pristionchus pacificus]|uniref:Uncharacterized protein n=1 Tax=Pristionchus pacificus TaxID=54126 RepID=A0A2A6BHK6_PRIPA|nr:hypothetical protein PRIPAC_78372 [Pristionchus pacificus]|eukprot:PDM65316.1 hypothetical protein PRIPAC_52258 [Pristionchus pacificus]